MASSKDPRKKPTQSRAQATVDAILVATDSVIVTRRSGESLSITAVAKRAGVSMGTFYQYFGSAEALLAAWEERGLEEDTATFKEMLDRLLSEHREMEDAIERAVRAMSTIVVRRMEKLRVLDREEMASRLAERMRLAKAGIDSAVAVLERSPDRHRLRPTDLASAVYVVFSAVVYVSYDLAKSDPGADALERVQRELVEMANRYLLAAA